MDTCTVPDVIQKLQTLVDDQQIRLEEASSQASDLQDQVKTLRSQVSSLKNAIYNAQQSLKEMTEKRNSMCDMHYMKSTKTSRPWGEDLHLDDFETLVNDNDVLNSIGKAGVKEEPEEQSYECNENGCTSTYKNKKGLKRHISDKHNEKRNGDENEEGSKMDFMNGISKLADQIKTGDSEKDMDNYNANYIGHTTPNDNDTDNNKRKRRSNAGKDWLRKDYPCDECSYVGRQDKLKRHKDTVHSDLKPFTCEYCDFAAKRKDKLKIHLEKKHY